MNLWQDVVTKAGIKINFSERMGKIERQGDEYSIVTNRATYLTQSVLLSIGRRGTPRKLDVAGEDQEKVVYRLRAPLKIQNPKRDKARTRNCDAAYV